jgi:hypothetical protein
MMDLIKIERINRQGLILLFTSERINGSRRESKDLVLVYVHSGRVHTNIPTFSSQLPIYAANQATANESRKCRSHKVNRWQVSGKYKTEDPLIAMAEPGGQSHIPIQSSVV